MEPPEVLAPEWVTGLSDGEASFTYSRSKTQIALYYAVKLTGADRPILGQLAAYFGGAGTIYTVAARFPTKNAGATKTAALYRISRVDELMSVVFHFDRYPLRTMKRNVYEVWRLMVLYKRKHERPDRAVLESLAEEISARCVRNQPWR